MNTQPQRVLSEDTIQDSLKYCLGELVGMVKHTHSFDAEPDKKARQEQRNVQAIKKAEATLLALFTQQLAVREREARIDERNTVIKQLDGMLELDKRYGKVKDEADSEWNEAINYAINKLTSPKETSDANNEKKEPPLSQKVSSDDSGSLYHTELRDNPGKCPICTNSLSSRNWRRHMKQHHGWLYDKNDALKPQGDQ